MAVRSVEQIVAGQETSDGAGVRLKRSLGTQVLDYLDPFLMLDEFGSDDGADYIAGFPDHPHRGIETVTYMLNGIVRHGDNQGHSGQLLPGGAQWMTAGRGIIHSEMPETTEGLMRGFQLWVNLPAADKMCEPRYQNFTPEEIPQVELDDGTVVRIIAGRVGAVEGAVRGIAAEPTYLDVTVPAGVVFSHPVPEAQNGFVYVFEGNVRIGEAADFATVGASKLAVLNQGDRVEIVGGDAGGRFILVAGTPINEPVARYGPFVMNTNQELMQAFDDYRTGKF